jgi:hypothetical protein
MTGSIEYFADVCSSYRVDAALNDIEKETDNLESLVESLNDGHTKNAGEKHIERLRQAHKDLVHELSDYEVTMHESELTEEQREVIGEWCTQEPKKALEQALTYLRDHEVEAFNFNFIAEGLGFRVVRS